MASARLSQLIRYSSIAIINSSVFLTSSSNQCSNDPSTSATISNQLPPFNKNHFHNVTILGGTANPSLTRQVCQTLGVRQGELDVTRFSDGEISVEIKESIRGHDCFLIQSCAAPVNDNIFELLLTITAARRSGAATVTVITPYFGYKHNRRGLPISTTYHSRFLWSAASDLAKMLQIVGADKVISVDLQRSGEGHESCFFDSTVPVESISSADLFVDYLANNIDLEKDVPVVIVSPSTELVKKACKYESLLTQYRPDLQVETSILLQENLSLQTLARDGTVEIFGEVRGRDVIIVDDFVDTATRLSVLCRLLQRQGARRVFVCASHGLFSNNSIELIDLSPVEKVIVTDSVPLPTNRSISQKIVQLSVAPLITKILDSEAATSHAIWDNEAAQQEAFDQDDDDDDNEIFDLE